MSYGHDEHFGQASKLSDETPEERLRAREMTRIPTVLLFGPRRCSDRRRCRQDEADVWAAGPERCNVAPVCGQIRPETNRCGNTITSGCASCDADRSFLLRQDRPDFEAVFPQVRVVDLFAGGGGLTVGAAEAARRVGKGTSVVLAVEDAPAIADVYARNFPKAKMRRSNVVDLFDGDIGAEFTDSEVGLAAEVGAVHFLLAGPPCQGHSDLNNHTRREDPRNVLYLRVARAAAVLQPWFVVVENVPAVRRDKGKVLDRSTEAFEATGYTVASRVLDLSKFGVPQRRRRHILIAVLGDLIDPAVVLNAISPCRDNHERTVRWAISDLVDQTSTSGPDAASTASDVNLERMRWLIDKDEYDLPNWKRPPCHRDTSHSYVSMYGRLAWDEPAPTITTGFGSMGQGRFMHPARPRTITPHEAARLQTLPDFFDLDATKGRGVWASVIGNAVPPLLGVHLFKPLFSALPPEPDSGGKKSTGRTAAVVLKGTPEGRQRSVPAVSSHHDRERAGTGMSTREDPSLQ